MTKDNIQLLFAYNRWANHRTFRAAATLTPEQYTRDLKGSFQSVCGTLIHLIGGEWGWLQYWQASNRTSEFLDDLWTRHDVLFAAEAFPDVAAIEAKWKEVETDQADFLRHLPDDAFTSLLPLGATFVTLAHLTQHVLNHSTYHRGQIATMIRQLGAEPVPTDFYLFLFEAPSGLLDTE